MIIECLDQFCTKIHSGLIISAMAVYITGSYSAASAGACTECSIGDYQDVTGQSSCTACDVESLFTCYR